MADTGLPLNVPYPEPTDLVRDGAAAIQAVAEVLNAPPGAYRYVGTRYYTSSGDFEKADPLGTGDIGLRAIRVRLVGGGGGGGGFAGATTIISRSGGAGAGYAEAFILAGSLSASETVTRGAGGTGAVGGTAATAGGTSSFGSLVVATGGSAGGFAAVAGGVGTAGDLMIKGSDGGQGCINVEFSSGYGGASKLGGQTRTEFFPPVAVNGNSAPANAYGAGGSGGSRQAAVSVNGGNGAPGIIIVDCFV